MILIYSILTPILLLQILKNPHFLFPLLVSQIALILFEKTSILAIFISQLLMSLQPSSIIYKKKITFYLNMFLTLFPYKTFSKRNLFLTFLILNNFVLLKIKPHHWLTTDILQVHHFQYQFFQNLTFTTKTKEQIQIYSLFLRKFFRHNYQLIWHSKFQDACINFPQQFTQNELLPFLDTPDNQQPQFYNLLDFFPLILNTLPMTPTVLIKVLISLLLFVLICNNTFYHLQLIQLPMFLFTLSPHLQMLY